MRVSKLFSAVLYLLVFVSPFFISPSLFARPLFINEFHYDNAGGDVNEFVEIAGVAGTDLNGWSLDFYNGSNGRVYASSNLSGVISNQQSGFGVLAFSASHSLQNGASDGIALIDGVGQVVQFLSYEGVLSATNGAAQGLTSVDVGIAESGSTPIGYSLQLIGMGSDDSDFIWSAAAASFDAPNNQQMFLSLPQSVNAPVAAVAEPSSLLLFLFGLVLLCARIFRFKFVDCYLCLISLKSGISRSSTVTRASV